MSDRPEIPPAARERLSRAGRPEGAPFTSSLSVAEALSVRQSGLEPLSQVMGTSYYKVGWQGLPWGSGTGFLGTGRAGETIELETQSQAYNEARRLAVGRLGEEARAAGADAVVGVDVRRRLRDWATDLVEFVAVGTAVRSTRLELAPDGEPLLSSLSGQDVAKLVAHGFWPVGIVGGSTVAYVVSSSEQNSRVGGLFSQLRNQELPDFTRGLYDARRLAMQHVTRQAHELHAHGVVGVSIERSESEVERQNATYTDLIIEMHVLGTAIVEARGASRAPAIYTALPLS